MGHLFPQADQIGCGLGSLMRLSKHRGNGLKWIQIIDTVVTRVTQFLL